jgi:hypothetical protein
MSTVCTRSRRALVRGAAGAALGAALAACGGGTEPAAPAAVPTLRRSVKLAWMTDAGTPAHLDARTQQIAAFQQATGIAVDYQGTPDFATKVQGAFASGTPPDLYFTRATTLTGEVAKKQAQPLDDLVKRDRFPLTDFYPASYEQYRVNGKVHALPFDYPNRALFANVTAFQGADGMARPRAECRLRRPGAGARSGGRAARRVSDAPTGRGTSASPRSADATGVDGGTCTAGRAHLPAHRLLPELRAPTLARGAPA